MFLSDKLLGQRVPEQAKMIESRLVQAIADPAFKLVDTTGLDDEYVTRRSAYDYAYDALWQLVASRRSAKNN
ncbi:hypothetical protein [Ktedonobacter sp. SOSP1-52]|uniref:hypothetical protein n=1 Tax=Ktedonobacter sp. SOSP1-52 TaxID=2778366 RepID=UPI001915E950|nr:hypothetical protein [Ktedonobacter sp. SOSP1-52]